MVEKVQCTCRTGLYINNITRNYMYMYTTSHDIGILLIGNPQNSCYTLYFILMNSPDEVRLDTQLIMGLTLLVL